jgi:hypothetical protein
LLLLVVVVAAVVAVAIVLTLIYAETKDPSGYRLIHIFSTEVT